MGNKLFIVESPAKAKTVGKYLGRDFVVKSSVGHIRDLPKDNQAIKIAEVSPHHWSFTPKYVVSDGKGKVVSELKAAAKGADEIFLASDPDREGEAIAWHLHEVLAPVAGDKAFHRVTYNEITKEAVLRAVASPRDIDLKLVDAQQARRILDRLIGYRVSPLLWKNIACANNRTLSAGRVQSVALRLLVERQREIESFKSAVYYMMGVEARKEGDAKTFIARLAKLDGEKPAIAAPEVAQAILLDLDEATLRVTGVKEQKKVRRALPPFTTSTLQQAASSVLGFNPGRTMKLAQSLYEAGFITYMRTDALSVSAEARQAAKDYIERTCGKEFYPEKPHVYAAKAKGGVEAQEAHEAIRPTKVDLTPQAAAGEKMDASEAKLYDLIWRRFVASQMADAKTTVTTIALEAQKPSLAHKYAFTASATTVDFEGFLKVMKLSLKKKTPDGEDDDETDEVAYLPRVAVGETLQPVRWVSEEKETKGPSHYSEASLIKALEENGVGRPSTYAATIETLKTRGYATTEKRKLIPLERGRLVCDWLVKRLNDLFSVGYTAQMEAHLDEIEAGKADLDGILSAFYDNLTREIGTIPEEAPPPKASFDALFAMLENVTAWKPAKKIGARTYDDKAFVESVKKQAAEGKRVLSARQLQSLARTALLYADQIPDCEKRLKELGLASSPSSSISPRADPELVAFCFQVLDRLGLSEKGAFMKSLHDQYAGGKTLSMKQFQILARTTGENAAGLPDGEAIREKLKAFVPEGFAKVEEDPAITKILELLKNVKEWRPTRKLGKRVYDDKAFVESLAGQYARSPSLSVRQVAALRKLAKGYASQVPGLDEALATPS